MASHGQHGAVFGHNAGMIIPSPAGLAAASPVARPLPARAVVDGQPISVATPVEALAAVERALAAGQAFTLFTLNLDHLVRLREDAAFRAAYRRATIVTADGAPVARLARRQDPAIVRTTGADLLLPILAVAARRQVSVFLFGGRDETLGAAAERLGRLVPGLAVAGTFAPPMNVDPTGPEADVAIRRIADSGAGLVVIALSAPRQELFADRLMHAGLPVGVLGFGASLDFVAGAQVRAPALMQRLGIEWVWRLAGNPLRLGRRYWRCALLMADLTLLAPFRRGRSEVASP
jgi:exopolysaccharide biosynthesis WecB/TagA/CpsF family protein